MSKATKQQLNTSSFTESEFNGCSDFITSAIYASLFLNAQGYEMKTTSLHQDNLSTIKLLNDGRASCRKKSRHIDIRYFFLKDRIDRGEFKEGYCPTGFMIAYFFSKPLQGSLFKKISAVIMGETDLTTFLNEKPPSPKEHVRIPGNIPTSDGNDVTNKDTYASVVKRNIMNTNTIESQP